MATSGRASATLKRFDGGRISGYWRWRGDRLRADAPRALLAIALSSALAGCSTSLNTYIVDPGRYSAYHCKQLIDRLKELQTRESDLRNLMDKASEGGGGTLIGGMSYRADYEKAMGEEKILRRTAADKKCSLEGSAFESDQVIR